MTKIELEKLLTRFSDMEAKIKADYTEASKKEIELKNELKKNLDDLYQPIRNEAEILKAEQKKYLGMCDGEPLSISSALSVMLKVIPD